MLTERIDVAYHLITSLHKKIIKNEDMRRFILKQKSIDKNGHDITCKPTRKEHSFVFLKI
jgi:hypothetical protein